MMHIRELMTADPEVCLATESCAKACEIMRRRHCGFVPIVDNHERRWVIGVVTDRDIALYLARTNCPASDVALDGCMTRDPKMMTPDASLEEAAHLMEASAIHRLPVVDNGRLVGVLSLKDIAVAANHRWGYPGARAVERQMTDIIEAIASSR